MSNYSNCSLCRYLKAKPWETPHMGFCCFCETSPSFGNVVSKNGNDGPGCECYEESTYKDMPFLKALKIMTLTPRTQEQMGNPYPYPLFMHREDVEEQPKIAIVFKDNTQLEDYRDAQLRVFEEVMKMMRENGEFVDEEEE